MGGRGEGVGVQTTGVSLGYWYELKESWRNWINAKIVRIKEKSEIMKNEEKRI